MTLRSTYKLTAFVFGSVFSLMTSSTLIATNLDTQAANHTEQLNPSLQEEYEKVLAIAQQFHHLGLHHHNHIAHKELYRGEDGKYYVPKPHVHHHPTSHHSTALPKTEYCPKLECCKKEQAHHHSHHLNHTDAASHEENHSHKEHVHHTKHQKAHHKKHKVHKKHKAHAHHEQTTYQQEHLDAAM